MLSSSKACFLLVVTIFSVASAQKAVSGKYAQTVRECYNKDTTKFNDCLFKFWVDIRADLARGIPLLKVPGLDPMTINNVEFNEQGAVVQANAVFKNVTVVGVGNYTPVSVVVDPANNKLTVQLHIPKLDIKGQYTVDGTILLLPVKGDGPFHAILEGIDATAIGIMARHGNGVKASSLTVDFTIKKITVRVENLLGGDSVGEAINNMLNENSQQILEDVKPSITKKLSEAILQVLGDAFLEMPPEAFMSQ